MKYVLAYYFRRLIIELIVGSRFLYLLSCFLVLFSKFISLSHGLS